MSDQIRAAVANYLAGIDVTVDSVHTGLTKLDEWECDSWAVTVKGPAGKQFTTSYHTGLGHRKWTKLGEQIQRREKFNPRCIAYEALAKEHLRPVKPDAASILYSLLLDARGAEQNFHDWCDDFGANKDSIKALTTYNACCVILAKMREMFTGQQRAELSKLLEDF